MVYNKLHLLSWWLLCLVLTLLKQVIIAYSLKTRTLFEYTTVAINTVGNINFCST